MSESDPGFEATLRVAEHGLGIPRSIGSFVDGGFARQVVVGQDVSEEWKDVAEDLD